MSEQQDMAPRRAILHLDSIHEISLVDFGANGYKYLIVKRKGVTGGTAVVADDDGKLSIAPDREVQLPEAVEMALRAAGKALGQFFKALDVNSTAADRAFTTLMDLFDRADALTGLVINMPATMDEGSLDSAIAEELAAMAGSLLSLSTMFGGSGQPVMMRAGVLDVLQDPVGQYQICPLVTEFGVLTDDSVDRLTVTLSRLFNEDVDKAGAKMSTANRNKLRTISDNLVSFVTSMAPHDGDGVQKSLGDQVRELTDLVAGLAVNQELATIQIRGIGDQVTHIAKVRGIVLPDSGALPHNDPPDDAQGAGDQ